MISPYYMGDGVPLKFAVRDADGVVNPTSCKMVILKPSNNLTGEVPATVDGNTVSYNVPSGVTNEVGIYRAYFVMVLPSEMARTHRIEFEVNRIPERF